jgi:uncharacterized protein (DUF1697 family)
MPEYVAFLRGMNVGGHRIKSEELCLLFTRMGFERVRSFRTAGNVLLTSAEKTDADGLSSRIEKGLTDALGYKVPVLLRTSEQVRAIAAFKPFEQRLIEASAGKLQVALLGKKPAKSAQARVLELSSEEDRLLIEDRELYWLPSAGILDSPLDLKTIAAALGQSTTRTKGTIDLIASKFFS